MALTFVDTLNMIGYLTKSDASEGFKQIIDFLNASAIQYALTVNPNIYVSCITKFWSSVLVKKLIDVTKLQALIDKKKVIITEDTVREALHLDDAKSIDCLPNEEIFTELARMGLVRNVDSSSKFYMYPQFLQLMIRAQVGKGFFGVETPLYEGMLVPQQADADVVTDDVVDDDVPAADAEPTPPSPPPTTTPPPPPQEVPSTSQFAPTPPPSLIAPSKVEALEQNKVAQALKIIKLKQRVKKLEMKNKGGIIVDIDADKDVTLEEVYAKDTEALKRKPRTEAQARKNMMIYLKNMARFKLDYFKGMSYDAIRPIFEKYFNSNVAFLEKTKEQLEEEESIALKRTSESLKEKAAKKQKLDQEVEELKKHLQIVPNDNDDVYTEATPLALKVPAVDYKIYLENNKPYYKIKRADGSHQLFLSFLSLLRNFDTEDLEVLWQIVKERFTSSKPKNFSDDFLLTILTYMFEKPNIQAQIWKNQKSVHGLEKGDAKGVTEEAPVAPRGGNEDEEMPQAMPPPSRTQGERIARLEEEVHGMREALQGQRVVLDSMAHDFSRFSTWTVTSLVWLMDMAGMPYTRYLESPIEYERCTRHMTNGDSTSTAPQQPDL
nr:hypothetical protein [Tanacetum cinerariifolium]